MSTRSKLHRLIEPKVMLDLQENFAHATGMGAVYTDEKGTHMNEGSNFSGFCKYIHCSKWGLNCCRISNNYATQIAMQTNRPFIYKCHAGLVDIEIPIIVNGELVGSFMAGQIRCHAEEFPELKQMPSSHNWLDDPVCRELYEQTEILSRKRIEAAAETLFVFANYIAENTMLSEMQNRINRKQTELLNELNYRAKLEKLLKMAEFNALQEQINPHFFFNILNSVSRLIHLGHPDEAQKTIDVFASMMRYSLQGTRQFVTLEKELDYIEKYLYLQNLRFGSRVTYRIDVDPDLMTLEIPFFSLQPFVENAIRHGLEPKDEGGEILISGRVTSKLYVITIRDDGVGMDEETLSQLRETLSKADIQMDSLHFGFLSAYERLRIHFTKDFSLDVNSAPGEGTTIQLVLKRR